MCPVPKKRAFDLILPRALPRPYTPPVQRPKALPAADARRSLAARIHQIGPFFPHDLFLGIAADGLPVLLNLADPSPGPLCIISEKTAPWRSFLFHTAYALSLTHPQANIRFLLISSVLARWQPLNKPPYCLGLTSHFSRQAGRLLAAAERWMYAVRRPRRDEYLLLLIDDLPTLAAHCEEETLLLLGDLLQQGPEYGLWPIVGLPASQLASFPFLQSAQATRIYGPGNFTPFNGPDSARLRALGEQEFLLSQGESRWLRFSLLG